MNRRLLALLSALAVTSLAFGEEEMDPPSRVARISTIQGNVSFQTEDSQAPEQAEINRPVTSGDRVLTESESRAELSLGTAALRMDEQTDLSISNLDDDIAQIELNSGAVSVHVRELASNETFEIDTPNATVRLTKPGDYRVDVDPDGASVLSVRNGDAEINGGSGVVHVHDQQQARLAPQAQYADVIVLGAPDAFDDWSMNRERELAAPVAERYVSREVVGYEDLDNYGTWSSDPEYGEVWSPTVVTVGWAPYTYGHWSYIGPWGWTWVDNSPWGFAPFHYGRWAYARNRWCWVPGPRHRRPVYAPALVGFASDRHDWAHSRNEHPRGWVPLGPREVYVPGRRVSPRYLRNVNVGNAHIDDNTRITNAYRNRSHDIAYMNRNAPGIGGGIVRPPNNGVPVNGLNGNGSLQNGPNERWRTGPGWRTGPTQGRLVTGREDRDHDGRRDDNDHNNRGSTPPWNNPARLPDGGAHWGDHPSIGRSPIVGDGRMTIPRTPDRDNVIQERNESQRERMRREVAEATHGDAYDRRLSQMDRSAQQREWQQRRNDQADVSRREPRSWNRGGGSDSSSIDRGSVRSNGGDRRPWSGGNGGNQSRPAPSQRIERPSPPPRMETRSSPPPQASRPSGGNNRGGDAIRGGGLRGQRQ